MATAVRIGSGAGYQGDRVAPALELLSEVQLDYIVLECLAERTLALAHARMDSGGVGYDPRLPQCDPCCSVRAARPTAARIVGGWGPCCRRARPAGRSSSATWARRTRRASGPLGPGSWLTSRRWDSRGGADFSR